MATYNIAISEEQAKLLQLACATTMAEGMVTEAEKQELDLLCGMLGAETLELDLINDFTA